MNTVEREAYQALSIELLLEKKIEQFFNNPEYDVAIFHAYAAKNSKLKKQLEYIEALIPMVRENIATGQMKRALKLLVSLDVLMGNIIQVK
ncbi:hypothetical protein [Solibacillus sp. FSL H8-0538]|uniref:hypothetical protein n=1 Tax=Solibacillus sp. FSL H8-0538 TaxID=2921400 RepID=UPI0030FBAF0F